MSSNERGHTGAIHPVRRMADEAHSSRDAFRPVALPALAAAVHVSRAATRAGHAHRLAARNFRLFIHEDDPVA